MRNSDFKDIIDALINTDVSKTARPNPPTTLEMTKYAINKNKNILFIFLTEELMNRNKFLNFILSLYTFYML